MRREIPMKAARSCVSSLCAIQFQIIRCKHDMASVRVHLGAMKHGRLSQRAQGLATAPVFQAHGGLETVGEVSASCMRPAVWRR